MGRVAATEGKRGMRVRQVKACGTAISIKTEWKTLRTVLRRELNHRRQWDREFTYMALKGHFRYLKVPLCKPWTCTAANQSPPKFPELGPHVIGKIKAVDDCEEHASELRQSEEWSE